MHFHWRITKYDPQYRNSKGAFLKEEWTSYSDIGKVYNDTLFTYEQYLNIETLYIKAILSFMNCCNIQSLQVSELEKTKISVNNDHNNNSMNSLLKKIKEGVWIEADTIESLCKLILREQVWCKLINNSTMYVHFGYDFYMYIASSFECLKAINHIKNIGLFIEEYKSPYE